jgi:hypothetical protein
MPDGKKERTARRSMGRNYPKPFSSSIFCLRLFSDLFWDWLMILGYSKSIPGDFERVGVMYLERAGLDETSLQEMTIVQSNISLVG